MTLAARSLQSGHWRVAVRRFMMIEAAGEEIPDALRQTFKELALRMRDPELLKIIADACAWAERRRTSR